MPSWNVYWIHVRIIHGFIDGWCSFSMPKGFVCKGQLRFSYIYNYNSVGRNLKQQGQISRNTSSIFDVTPRQAIPLIKPGFPLLKGNFMIRRRLYPSENRILTGSNKYYDALLVPILWANVFSLTYEFVTPTPGSHMKLWSARWQ